MDMKYSSQYTHNYIEGNVYAITGAGGGFGRATALEVLKMGGMVVLNDYIEERLNGTMQLIAELGKADQAIAVLGDCAKLETNEKIVAAAVENFGKLDCFWANAGIMPHALMEKHDAALAKWEECIDTLVKGCLHGICASYDQFAAQGYGHFMVTSSVAGNWASPTTGVYSGCKMAVRYLAHCLRIENPGLISVTVINPTFVASTNLLATVVDTTSDQAGQLGTESFDRKMKALMSGEDKDLADVNSPKYVAINSEDMARSVVYAMNQPRGISIGEITVRCTNEDMIA